MERHTRAEFQALTDIRIDVLEMIHVLDWTLLEQIKWAQTITNIPSEKWGHQEWKLAKDVLQQHVDREGLTQALIERGADY